MTKPVYGASIHIRTFCMLLRLLHEGDVTRDQIMERLGITDSTASRWLSLLGANNPIMPGRLVYVSGWIRAGSRGNYARQWSYGFEMEDAPKPKPMTQTQYSQRYRAKMRGYDQLIKGNHAS